MSSYNSYSHHGIGSAAELKELMCDLIEKHQEAVSVFKEIAETASGVIELPLQDFEATLHNHLTTELEQMWFVYCRTNQIEPVTREENTDRLDALESVKATLETHRESLKEASASELDLRCQQIRDELTKAISILEAYI